ncbi:MAG: TIGR01777 family protein [Gammaproteobacteria bacterium]|nr:MAG: TIGR01777 family protein [Gammaproteobacteria bacterium]
MQGILITGGTGFIGSALIRDLMALNHQITVLTRSPEAHRTKFPEQVRLVGNLADIDQQIDSVVNLAGANLFARRWTTHYKQCLRQSRIELTRQLVAWMEAQASPPHTLISGSAVGYYGDRGDAELTERAPAGFDFGAQLCRDWEAEANAYKSGRVVCIRTGIVLGNGGALKQMLPPFKFGLGAILGSGNQYWPWISLADEVAAIRWIMDNETMIGPVNLTAPEPVPQSVFAKTLARQLRRPCFLNMPASVLRLIVGEASEILLASQRCVPEVLMEHGFRFQYPSLTQALKSLL